MRCGKCECTGTPDGSKFRVRKHGVRCVYVVERERGTSNDVCHKTEYVQIRRQCVKWCVRGPVVGRERG